MLHGTAAHKIPLGLALALVLCCAAPATAQVAAPGDVYYKVHVDQQFRYYVFAGDYVAWENADHEGTSVASSAAHDTAFAYGNLGVSSSFAAGAGVFTADMDSHITLDARTGIYHLLANSLKVDLYVRGATGTPYWIAVSGSGQLDASRLGGTSGSLQAVNGLSSVSFMDSTARMDSTGAVSIPVAESWFVSGFTTAQILVGADTYSLARSYTFSAPATVTQALCILGCMTTPATFNAVATGHVEIQVFPYVTPLEVSPDPGPNPGLSVRSAPNPLRSATTVSFRAAAGERARVEVFDTRGRRVATIYDGAATGGTQQLAWHADGLAEGLYLLRIRAGTGSATAKIALLK